MPEVSVDGGEIYYETHGAGSPVLLVPGLGGVGGYWAPNLPAFAARHRTVVHDHRGTGRSSRARIRYSVDQMTRDLVAVMDDLGIEKAHLVGHSTGGAMGQTLAATHPERLASLVIYASWTKADPFFRRVFEARRALLLHAGTTAYIRSTAVFLYPDWWINQNIGLLEEREGALAPGFPPAEIVASRIDAIVDFDRTADLPKIRVPTLVICAEDDILTPPYFSAELARLIPDAELVLLERGGHCASETNAAAFDAAVLDFIARQDAPGVSRARRA
ncbi:MAG: pyrimidine utilization protein D [Bradyrhizobiaceae bacterium]|nr:MAG: pyrimidine utilization protein D [Bradyrhizobiaceae bacterium]